MSEDQDEKLEELLKMGETVHEKLDNNRKTHQSIREDIVQMVMDSEDKFTKEEVEQLREHIENSNYAEAREVYNEAIKRKNIRFEDEELTDFAEAFQQDFEDLVESMEVIKNSLVDLRKQGMDQDTQIATIYGSTSVNKSTIKDVYDVIEELETMDNSVDNLASFLAGSSSKLKVKETEKVLEKMKDLFGEEQDG